MKRTKYLVKILVEEHLPIHKGETTYSIYEFWHTSRKYHCECIGLQTEIETLLWEPFDTKYFTGGRYLKGITAIPVGRSKDCKAHKKLKC